MPGTLSRLLHDIGFDVFDDGHGLPVHVDFLPNVHHSRVVATNFTTSWGKCRTPYKGYKFCHGVEDDYCAEIAKLEYEEEAPAPSQPEEGATKAEGEHAAPVPAEGEHAAPMPAEGEGEHEPEGEHKPEDEGEHKHAGGEGEHTSEGKGEPKPAEEKAAEDKASEAKPEDEAAEAKPEPKEITEDSLNLVNYVTKKGFPEAEVKAMVKVERDNGKEKICGCLGDYAGGQAFALCPQGVAKGAHGGNPLCSDGKGAVGNNRKFGEEFQPGDKITFLGRKCEEGKEIKCDE
eukprot:gnl/TRDRNA2_/TRDRNA2_170204_c0_seq12.p1 gnl/TRDRNA2_/TRDRNA2_170204_c0~~gnl/TRDRNA2_/TRDRNA2_170204_c0_seq12.p1  ORF type:complete len:289 (+),score=68.63 gnl/TRDRNA2_/TRDRNA2_170204_c0_seq12:65-931(+)